jgi:hypothetical protein
MSLIKTFAISSKLFSFYQKDIDVNKVESIDEIILLLVTELDDLLIKNNLEILSEELHKCKFHIHGFSFDDIKKECTSAKYYICDHDH